ncbi:MAG TPA: SufE family protein, partial [Candidatus Binatia bacterium]|nr:SufE family protein [Candidatus Binatia bacterium]
RQVFERLGLESHITMNRRNGFYAMVERIRAQAASEAAVTSGPGACP